MQTDANHSTTTSTVTVNHATCSITLRRGEFETTYAGLMPDELAAYLETNNIKALAEALRSRNRSA
jgi:hypothetical protein